MKILANILWVIFGGLILSILWIICGILYCITIIGIPFGIQCFKLASFVIWPFGSEIVYGGGTGSLLMNIIWIILFGWELALTSLVIGLLWCITIIGIPFGIQSFKFAKLALMPFGTEIISK